MILLFGRGVPNETKDMINLKNDFVDIFSLLGGIKATAIIWLYFAYIL